MRVGGGRRIACVHAVAGVAAEVGSEGRGAAQAGRDSDAVEVRDEEMEVDRLVGRLGELQGRAPTSSPAPAAPPPI